jgi:hypothetical protein
MEARYIAGEIIEVLLNFLNTVRCGIWVKLGYYQIICQKLKLRILGHFDAEARRSCHYKGKEEV